jgi:hypothetical protein
MPTDTTLRKVLLDYLDRPRTHAPFAAAVKDLPTGFINKKLPNVPYTPWMLVEHIRRTQHDMIDFMRNKNYKGMAWPKDYWPDLKQKADRKMWNASVAEYEKEAKVLKAIVKNPKNDLLVRIPWGEGQTILREVMQIIDHTGYHVGELVALRRMMGIWKS